MGRKKSFGTIGLLMTAVAAFVACGDEVTEVNEYYATGLKVVESKQKMPTCDKTVLGDMLYVTDSSAVFYCNGKKWVNVKSRDGKDGVDGQDGIDGEKARPIIQKMIEQNSIVVPAVKGAELGSLVYISCVSTALNSEQ